MTFSSFRNHCFSVFQNPQGFSSKSLNSLVSVLVMSGACRVMENHISFITVPIRHHEKILCNLIFTFNTDNCWPGFSQEPDLDRSNWFLSHWNTDTMSAMFVRSSSLSRTDGVMHFLRNQVSAKPQHLKLRWELHSISIPSSYFSFTFLMMQIEPRTLSMRHNCSTTELHP